MKKVIGILTAVIVISVLFASGRSLGWFGHGQEKADLSAGLAPVLEKNEQPKEPPKPEHKIVFVGDMMFDRGVESLMEGVGFTYPVELIKDFLNGFDYAVGNLEGPINKEPKEFPDSSLTFSFNEKSVESLKAGNFKVVSLANNHTSNMGNAGLEETREILKANDIGYAGDPISCGIDYLYQKDEITYYAVNETYASNCSEKQLTNAFIDARHYNPESFIVAIMHWGTEYSSTSSASQQEMAHDLVGAGADLVIGSHPHVVQEIEEYQGKPIFYSLGNFIFDQYFSEETQQGLAVGMEKYADKVVYTLYPVKNRLAQPKLMEGDDKQNFLDDLAGKSDKDLAESIKKGVIEIDNK
jgi:poly-gamma-glutamate synthesis protein (capsule biosynthesis protein)